MKFRVSVWQLGLLIVLGCLSNLVFANAGELSCKQDPESKTGELICTFRLDTTKSIKDQKLKHCINGMCVTAAASIEPEGDPLKVGMATYRKPFAQYYPSEIALWLNQAPKKASIQENLLEWAKWCGTLGGLHIRNYKGWYDLELAINVLQEAIRLVEDHFENAGSDLVGNHEWDSFRALSYCNLGEAYYLDPEMKHGTEALDHYEKALSIYQSLIEENQEESESSSTGHEYDSTRHVYAMTLAKMGSALIQLHSAGQGGLLDPIIDNQQDVDGTLASTTTISNFNDNANDQAFDPTSSRPPKLQRASEVLILALEFYQGQCQEHLPANTGELLKPSEYVEACVDYATTLQYAATVESLSSNYQQALDYMKRALLVYTVDKDILHQEPPVTSIFARAVLANVYNMWYHMGSTESIGSMLVNLADTCGQLGKHEESKANYKLAMTFYSDFQIPPPPTTVGGGEASMDPETKTLLDSYMSMLEEYRRGTADNVDPNKPMYQKDDIYEGDILYNIGTMYMHAGDEKEGMEWLEQAILVYQRNIHKPGTYSKDRQYTNPRWSQIASMYASLTRIYFGQGRFDDSIRAHEQSMDLFRELYGDGVNPYVQYLQEQVLQATGNDSSMNAAGEMIASDTAINLENYLQSIKNATEKLETLGEEEKKKKDEL